MALAIDNEPETNQRGPRIPIELYRSIVAHIGSDDPEFKTLLRVAQCSFPLCCESQRILFRSNNTPFWSLYGSVRRHLSFVEAIISSPARLGGYVLEYTQVDIACDLSYLGSDEAELDPSSAPERIKLFERTMTAIPAMINLKKLIFEPRYAKPSASLLSSCVFRLDSLCWQQCECETEFITAILPRQSQLRHLSVFWCADTYVNDEFVPDLTSVGGGIPTLCAFVPSRKIVALDCAQEAEHPVRNLFGSQRAHEALHGLQYLRIEYTNHLSRLFRSYTLPHTIVLLEIDSCWNSRWELEFFQYLPATLRVLVLRLNASIQLVEPRNDDQHTAMTAFQTCSNLKYVDIPPQYPGMHGWRFTRPSSEELTGGHYGRLCAVDVMFPVYSIEWWKDHFWGDLDN